MAERKMPISKLKNLAQFSACDISDALVKLKVPSAGFLHDLRHFAPSGVTSDKLQLLPKIAAPASTVLLVPKGAAPSDDLNSFEGVMMSNIPSNQHWVDLTPPDTFVVLSQPSGQTCAALGGIMASRMKKCGAKGILVGGRVRDLTELKTKHIPIWASGTSTVGSGAETKPWAMNVPVTIQGVLVKPGDIVFSDPIEGIVIIPQDKLDSVMELAPKLVKADEKIKEEVEKGMLVKEAFARFRGV